MSISQDGSGFPFLAPPIYEYLCGKKDIDIVLDDIASFELREFLQQVSNISYVQSCTVYVLNVNTCTVHVVF